MGFMAIDDGYFFAILPQKSGLTLDPGTLAILRGFKTGH